MGLPFRIVLYAPTGAIATNAATAAFARISELNAILSDYEETSELSRLSRSSGSGQWVPLGTDLAWVLKRSEYHSRASGGAFDVTVGPLVQLWRRARRQHELPSPERIAIARRAVGWTNVVLEPGRGTSLRARLDPPGMKLDLGGIAKGYALEEAFAVLRRHGINRALVAGGGDLFAGDPPPDQDGWRIEVGGPSPADSLTSAQFVLLKQASLCTSGDIFQHVEIGGVRYSHIVDPHTGIGITNRSLVTVIAPSATDADAMATALSVLGPGPGLAYVENQPGAASHFSLSGPSGIQHAESSRWQLWVDRDRRMPAQ